MFVRTLGICSLKNVLLTLSKNISICRRILNVRPDIENCVSPYISGSNADSVRLISNSFSVYEDFISEDEEESLLNEIDPVIRRRRYEYDHWDGAIQGYKEMEKLEWNDKNSEVIQRLRNLAFPPESPQIKHVHVLDLAKSGHIKPHIDSIRFCGDTIAGISLLSTCVMKLTNEKSKIIIVDVLIPRRSLYIMRGVARYEFTHEVLEEKASFFKGGAIPRDRRVSIICRNEPSNQENLT